MVKPGETTSDGLEFLVASHRLQCVSHLVFNCFGAVPAMARGDEVFRFQQESLGIRRLPDFLDLPAALAIQAKVQAGFPASGQFCLQGPSLQHRFSIVRAGEDKVPVIGKADPALEFVAGRPREFLQGVQGFVRRGGGLGWKQNQRPALTKPVSGASPEVLF